MEAKVFRSMVVSQLVEHAAYKETSDTVFVFLLLGKKSPQAHTSHGVLSSAGLPACVGRGSPTEQAFALKTNGTESDAIPN